MWYHALANYGDKKRVWWNRKKDDIINDVLLPFVSKQVKPATRQGISSLFNFGSADYITILQTQTRLKRASAKKIPSEFNNADFLQKHNVTDEFVDTIRLLKSSGISRSLVERSLSEPEDKIFVIMKYGDEELDSAYEGVYKPLGESFGYTVVRVDEIQDSGSISEQILENIASSKIIIAELTGERPNCYYEAGFAHALGKEIIFAIKEGDNIHFDVSGYRFLVWRTEAQLRNKLRARLESISSKDSG